MAAPTEPTLRVVVAHKPPFVFVDRSFQSPRFYGFLIELLPQLLNAAGIHQSYEFYESPVNTGGSLTSSGNWTGLVGELFNRKAELSLFPLSLTSARSHAINMTYSVYDAGLALLVPKLEGGSMSGPTQFLLPFTPALWATIVGTVFVMAVLFNLLDWMSKRRELHAAASQGLPVHVGTEKHGGGHMFFSSMIALTGNAQLPRHGTYPMQLLYIFYCLFCLIVISSYTANLTAFLTVNTISADVQALTDLLRQDLLFGVIPNGSTAAYFQTSQDYLALGLQKNMRFCSSSDACVALVRSGSIAAYISDEPLLDYYASQSPCDLLVTGRGTTPGNLVIGLQPNSTLLNPLNTGILKLRENGVTNVLVRRWFHDLSQCNSDDQVQSSTIGLPEFWGVFLILVGGTIMAVSLSIAQNFTWCVMRRYPQVQELPRTISQATFNSINVPLKRISSSLSFKEMKGSFRRSFSRSSACESPPPRLPIVKGVSQGIRLKRKTTQVIATSPLESLARVSLEVSRTGISEVLGSSTRTHDSAPALECAAPRLGAEDDNLVSSASLEFTIPTQSMFRYSENLGLSSNGSISRTRAPSLGLPGSEGSTGNGAPSVQGNVIHNRSSWHSGGKGVIRSHVWELYPGSNSTPGGKPSVRRDSSFNRTPSRSSTYPDSIPESATLIYKDCSGKPGGEGGQQPEVCISLDLP